MKNRVKVLRTELGITQIDLAEQLSVSRQSIHAIETGKYVPSTVLALKLSKTLQVSVEKIFDLEPND